MRALPRWRAAVARECLAKMARAEQALVLDGVWRVACGELHQSGYPAGFFLGYPVRNPLGYLMGYPSGYPLGLVFCRLWSHFHGQS